MMRLWGLLSIALAAASGSQATVERKLSPSGNTKLSLSCADQRCVITRFQSGVKVTARPIAFASADEFFRKYSKPGALTPRRLDGRSYPVRWRVEYAGVSIEGGHALVDEDSDNDGGFDSFETELESFAILSLDSRAAAGGAR